jgi:hypothetical protein
MCCKWNLCSVNLPDASSNLSSGCWLFASLRRYFDKTVVHQDFNLTMQGGKTATEAVFWASRGLTL